MPATSLRLSSSEGESAGEGNRDPCQPLPHLHLVQVVKSVGLTSTPITAVPMARPVIHIGTGHAQRVTSNLRLTPTRQRHTSATSPVVKFAL